MGRPLIAADVPGCRQIVSALQMSGINDRGPKLLTVVKKPKRYAGSDWIGRYAHEVLRGCCVAAIDKEGSAFARPEICLPYRAHCGVQVRVGCEPAVTFEDRRCCGLQCEDKKKRDKSAAKQPRSPRLRGLRSMGGRLTTQLRLSPIRMRSGCSAN
jgi:hypothetical protein